MKDKVKINNKNIHIECVGEYEKQREQKRIETEQFNELYDYIKGIHNCLDVPPRNIKRLREIKENKNITYKLILDAYKIAEEKLKWFIRDVLHDVCDAEAINKAITVVVNSGLNEAWKQEQMRKKREEERTEIRYDPIIEREITFVKKESSVDISEFL